jgi:glycosyltransferase involved in cell wall biosynthesis
MKALMLINTSGLDYDDRLRKESLSLRDLGYEVEIVALEYANEAGQRTAYDHIPATTIRVHSRNWFARSKGLPLKMTEAYLQFLRWIWRQRPDILWFHTFEPMGMVPFFALMRKSGFIKRLIWDQHELPPDSWLSRRTWLRFLGHLCNRCDVVVSANEQRRQLLHELLDGTLRTPIEVLENYPDTLFFQAPIRDLPKEARQWLAGRPYVLAQGGASPKRHLDQVVSAVLGTSDLTLIVIGPYREGDIRRLRELHGSRFDERVWLTGFVAQMDVIPYIDHALLGIVLYEMSSENRRLCAPNRLYQAVSRGVPVVVGANPPMVEFVHRWRCGVALKTDGCDATDIHAGILEVQRQHDRLRENSKRCQTHIRWESQAATIAHIARTAGQDGSPGTAQDRGRGTMARDPETHGEEQGR